MKRFFTFNKLWVAMLLFALPLCAWSAVGDTFTAKTIEGVDMTFKITSEGESTVQVGGSWAVSQSTTGSITIPATVTYNAHKYFVTSIGESAFCYCSGLTSVTIPYGTATIEDSAFEGCSKMRRLSLSGSIRYIGEGAFRGCAGIVSVTIPDSVEEIGDGAFAGCSRLVSASIPMGTRLGERVFPANCDIRLERRTGK